MFMFPQKNLARKGLNLSEAKELTDLSHDWSVLDPCGLK